MVEVHLIKNRIYELSKRIKMLKNIFEYQKKKERINIIKLKLKDYDIWNQKKYAQKLSKEYSDLEIIMKFFNKINNDFQNAADLLDLAIEANEQEIFNEVDIEIDNICKNISKLEFTGMFSKQNDKNNCYIDLQSGSGGTESQDWTNMLLRMYLRWADDKNFKVEIIEESIGEIAGIKSSTLKISGNYAFGYLRTETGIHRLVRKSPFNAGGRRHTSFSSVFVYPELEENIDMNINQSDLRIDVYRASGAGGQHVNRTESAVRVTHIPTGLVAQCQSGRSQHKNKNQAIKQIKSKLFELELQNQQNEKQILENSKSKIRWGNQIRSYVLDDSRIKDLRTGVEIYHVQSVLDGNLDCFIEASLKAGL